MYVLTKTHEMNLADETRYLTVDLRHDILRFHPDFVRMEYFFAILDLLGGYNSNNIGYVDNMAFFDSKRDIMRARSS